MPVVTAAHGDSALRCLGQAHAGAAAPAVDALSAHNVIRGAAAQRFGRNLPQFPYGVGCGSVGRPGRGMRRLAAARGAAPRQILVRPAPGNNDLVPGNPHQLRGHPLGVAVVPRTQIAHARLDIQFPVRLDDQKTVKASGTPDKRTTGDAYAANLGAVALSACGGSFLPAEHCGAAIQRLLHEATGRVGPCASLRRRAEFRLTLGRIDLMNFHLIDAESARRLGEQRLHQGDPLHAPRLTLGRSGRGVGQNTNPSPAHRRRLVQQGYHRCGVAVIAPPSVGAVVCNRVHIQRRDPTILGESAFQATGDAGSGSADVVLVFPGSAQHHRRVALPRQNGRNHDLDSPSDLGAESAAGVLTDHDNVVLIHVHPAGNGGYRLDGALRAHVNE